MVYSDFFKVSLCGLYHVNSPASNHHWRDWLTLSEYEQWVSNQSPPKRKGLRFHETTFSVSVSHDLWGHYLRHVFLHFSRHLFPHRHGRRHLVGFANGHNLRWKNALILWAGVNSTRFTRRNISTRTFWKSFTGDIPLGVGRRVPPRAQRSVIF